MLITKFKYMDICQYWLRE